MTVQNNEHQRIDDVPTDLISYGIQSLKTTGFLILYMNYLIVLFKRHNDCLSLIVMTCCCKLHDLANFQLFQNNFIFGK